MIKKISSRKLSETVMETLIKAFALVSVLMIGFIFVFICARAWPVLRESGLGLLARTGFDAQIQEAFYSSGDAPMLRFGFFGLIAGTFVSTLFALLLAAALGIGGAIVICEFTPRPVSYALTSVARLLASIPSVVFGLISVVSVVPWIQETFISDELELAFLHKFQMTGRGLLASVVVLTFMLVPTIAALSTDAIRAVPKRYRESGFAVGMSHFRVIWKVLLPAGRSGIIASVILAAGRGLGEAIAISMVCGGVGVTPDFVHNGPVAFLAPILPLSAAIINKSEAMGSEAVNAALFACAVILLAICAALSIIAKFVEKRLRRKLGYED